MPAAPGMGLSRHLEIVEATMPDLFADIEQIAKTHPPSLALISKEGNLEYRGLVETVETIAGHAVSNGLAGGQIVHVETDNDDMRLLLFLGLMRAGATVAALLPAGRALFENGVMPDVVVTDRSEKSALAQRTRRAVRFARDWFRPDRRGLPALPDRPDYTVIFASSGSTGEQKLILESRANMEYNFARRLDQLMYAGYIRYLPGVGETSHGTFPYYLLTLRRGGSIIRLRQYSPEEIIAATCLLRPSYAKIAPMTLAQILKVVDDAPRRFRKVDHLNLGGAYCSAATRQQALGAYAERGFTTYGATEISQIATGEFADIGETDGSVGWVVDGVTVETIDENGSPVPHGSEGEIRVKPAPDAVTR